MGLEGLADTIRMYYRDLAVRQRMSEFLGGGPESAQPSAVYIAENDGSSGFGTRTLVSSLAEGLEAGLEVERSLWDREFLIADIDIEYENFDAPALVWTEPERPFAVQQPVLESTLGVLNQAGAAPLVLMSGRGFHLVWAISRASPAFHRLARLGRIGSGLEARYDRARSPRGDRIDYVLGRAFAGLGMLLEFVGHRVIRATREGAVPVQLTSVEVGAGPRGREIISFDLSEYGDPLHTRLLRLPFSAYLKPRHFARPLGDPTPYPMAPKFILPLCGMPIPEALNIAQDPRLALELAQSCSALIPDQSRAMEDLLDSYEASDLAAFHEEFHAEPWEQKPCRAGIPPAGIPGAPRCVNCVLENPNDWLLKPVVLQHVVRTLLALGWRPREIVDVINAGYQRKSDWGDVWSRLEPLNRAVFYTRLFAGMIATGVDQLVDFNCVSHQEKGYCSTPDCRANLTTYRDALLERRAN